LQDLKSKKKKKEKHKKCWDWLGRNKLKRNKRIWKKKAQQKDLLDQISAANQNSIATKHGKIVEAKLEDDKIHKYNLEKAQKEAEAAAEQKRAKEEKEREVARLRELQEKASDRNAELDALRAKRAFEQADRQARDKERIKAETKARNDQELFEARRSQAFEKEARLQEQVKQDRDDFHKVIEAQKIHKDQELKLEHEKKLVVAQHANEVKKQMLLNEEKRLQQQRTYKEEGKKMRDELVSEKKILENIKGRKLESLQSEGIPAKYGQDLAKKKIII